jgi:hypothetical protein
VFKGSGWASVGQFQLTLFSAAVHLADAGKDREPMLVIDLAKRIQNAEEKIRRHTKGAGVGIIVKRSKH